MIKVFDQPDSVTLTNLNVSFVCLFIVSFLRSFSKVLLSYIEVLRGLSSLVIGTGYLRNSKIYKFGMIYVYSPVIPVGEISMIHKDIYKEIFYCIYSGFRIGMNIKCEEAHPIII